MNFRVVGGLALLGDEIHHILKFFVGDKRALGAFQVGGAGRQVQHVALAEQFVRAHCIENRP